MAAIEIQVNRIKSNKSATLSTVSINGVFECFGLEDEHRYEKKAGETRIPEGTYKVKLRTEGGFHNRYTQKFGASHKGMLHVQDVPGFEYILIHVGNTDKDTAGCLLVGSIGYGAENLSVGSSTPSYLKLYDKVIDSAARDDLFITYTDSDRG